MTAHPARLRRRTIVGGAIVGVLSLIAVALTVVGAFAVANSTEGEAVVTDDRPVAALPVTDNAALAVVDADNRLVSLVVATLLPGGSGGSLVVVPVGADVNNGFGDEVLPVSAALDPADPDGFFRQIEAMLAITLQFGEIAGSDRVEQLLGSILPVDVALPVDVSDSDTVLFEAGAEELTGDELLQVFVAAETQAGERVRHSIDVAVWSGAAAAAPRGDGDVIELDEAGRPTPSSSIDEVFARLWSGNVQARDLQLAATQPDSDSDAVILDRADVVLVFAQVSPARVSTPLPGPVFRVVMPITDVQLEAAAAAGAASREQVARRLVEEMLFYEVNVVSVDLSPNPAGAPEVTRVEVADPDFVDVVAIFWESVLGEIDVVLADERIDGVDVVVQLGTAYLDTERSEFDASTGDDAATVDEDG